MTTYPQNPKRIQIFLDCYEIFTAAAASYWGIMTTVKCTSVPFRKNIFAGLCIKIDFVEQSPISFFWKAKT